MASTAASPCAAELSDWLGSSSLAFSKSASALSYSASCTYNTPRATYSGAACGCRPMPSVTHVDTDLERLVREGDVRKIDVQVRIPRIEQDRLTQRAHGVRRVAGILVGAGRELERLRIGRAAFENRAQRVDRLARLRGHQLNRGQQPALAGIVGTKRDRALKHRRGLVEPLQPDEARAVGVQRVELRVEERAGLLEVADRRLALAVAVLEDGEHRVGGRIVGAQLGADG